jgi:UDP-glucose 4-epimerase
MIKSALVIGAYGFIGRHLHAALGAAGVATIVGTHRLPRDRATLASPHVDMADAAAVRQVLGAVDCVIHTASGSTPGGSAGRPFAELDCNLGPTLALLELLQEYPNIRLVYLSSGGSLYTRETAGAATEESAVFPRSYHGATKLAIESFILALHTQYGNDATIIRPSNVYGPGQIPRSGFGIVPTGFDHMLHERPMTIWGDGLATRDYVYVDDVVELCVAMLRAEAPEGVEIFNASSGIGTSLNALLECMELASGLALRRAYTPARAIDARRVVIDSRKANEKYDWSARTSLDDGIMRTWKWLTSSRP